jgi:hypothetical protein
MTRPLLIIMAVAAIPCGASADVLGTHTVNHAGGGSGLATAMTFAFGWGEDPPGIVNRLFEDVPVTPDDVGRTFVATAQTDADFAAIAAGLTDGTSEGIVSGQQVRFYSYFYPDGGGGSNGGPESVFFDDPDLIDFHGFQITEIDLTIYAFTLTSPGWDPNGDGIWTDYSATVTVSVIGIPIPEPNSLLLFGLSVAFALGRREASSRGSFEFTRRLTRRSHG